MNYTTQPQKETPQWFFYFWIFAFLILLALKALGQTQYTHRDYINGKIIEFEATHKEIRKLSKAFIDEKDIPPLDTTGLPVMNKKVLHFVDSVLNKRVGKGICWELTTEALKYAGAWVEVNKKHFGNLFTRKRFTQQGHPIMQRQTKPGDIVDFQGHIAIIYRKLNDFDFLIVHQSIRTKKKVVISFYCSDCPINIHGFRLFFLRPD